MVFDFGVKIVQRTIRIKIYEDHMCRRWIEAWWMWIEWKRTL